MLQAIYHQLRKELAEKGTFQPHTAYGLITLFTEGLIFTSSFIGLMRSPHFSWAYWLCELLLGLSAFRLFVILHECGHHTLFRQRWLNTCVGYLVSPLCFHPYECWRQIHNQHHQWAGIVDKDPTAVDPQALKQSPVMYSILSIAWRLWFPLGMLHHVLTVYWLYPLQKFRQGQLALAFQGLFAVAIAALPHMIGVAYWGMVDYLILVLPFFLMAFMWNEAITIPLHAGLYPFASTSHPTPLPYSAHDGVTRNTELPAVLAVLLAYNFNFHIEHHLFPYAPWYRLPQIKQALQRNQQSYDQGVKFPGHMINARSHEPAVLFQGK
ncbi:fatty acid desaturase [Oscillatoria sp. FACHB-1407]|uniref:fatty acid desaturase family protein n=1 Tax=Oscillatoria sp. FACHB-1407 TaxID=2692847 RepID=UPI00168A01BA|nr:fatty acid desaturase [Oscillatoria sp. FACHB-1407]MBD2465845.1 fatty acid desaturase [Oscillatoria sp. FACHB-1407]